MFPGDSNADAQAADVLVRKQVGHDFVSRIAAQVIDPTEIDEDVKTCGAGGSDEIDVSVGRNVSDVLL